MNRRDFIKGLGGAIGCVAICGPETPLLPEEKDADIEVPIKTSIDILPDKANCVQTYTRIEWDGKYYEFAKLWQPDAFEFRANGKIHFKYKKEWEACAQSAIKRRIGYRVKTFNYQVDLV